jgi:hypothetical protein
VLRVVRAGQRHLRERQHVRLRDRLRHVLVLIALEALKERGAERGLLPRLLALSVNCSIVPRLTGVL